MSIPLLADENFNRKIVDGLRRRSADIDLVTVQEVGLRTLDDPTVLDWAGREGRVLVTHDLATILQPAYERVATGLPMPGVLEVRESLPIVVVIDELLLINEASTSEDWQDRVHYLPLR